MLNPLVSMLPCSMRVVPRRNRPLISIQVTQFNPLLSSPLKDCFIFLKNYRYLIDLCGIRILKPKSTLYILNQMKQVIAMRKSGAVKRRDDMIDLMIDTIREEDKYRQSIDRGGITDKMRFDN